MIDEKNGGISVIVETMNDVCLSLLYHDKHVD